jgi:hypothetical protein
MAVNQTAGPGGTPADEAAAAKPPSIEHQVAMLADEHDLLRKRVTALHGEALLKLVEDRLSRNDEDEDSGGWSEPAKVLAIAALIIGVVQFAVAQWQNHLAKQIEDARKTQENDLATNKLATDVAAEQRRQRFAERQLLAESLLAAKNLEDRARVAAVLDVLSQGAAEPEWYRSMVVQLKALIDTDKAALENQKTPPEAAGRVAVSEAVAQGALLNIQRVQSRIAENQTNHKYVQLTLGDCGAMVRWAPQVASRGFDVSVFKQRSDKCAFTIGRFEDAEAKNQAQTYKMSREPQYVAVKKLTGLGDASPVDGAAYTTKLWP